MNENNGQNQNQVIPSEMTADVPETERRHGISVLARVALVTVVVSALIISVVNVMKYNELMSREEELKEQIEAYDKENAELQYLINAPMDRSYIERIAREKYHLRYPDEDVFYSNYKK